MNKSHGSQKRKGTAKRLFPKEYPSHHDDHEKVDVPKRAPEALDDCAKAKAFQHEKQSVEQSPEDERPARPVPKAAKKEDRDQIAVGLSWRGAIASQRHVQVVAKPRRE